MRRGFASADAGHVGLTPDAGRGAGPRTGAQSRWPVGTSSEDPRVALERLRPAPGYEVSLFASEEQFPDLAKPLAMTFDSHAAGCGC